MEASLGVGLTYLSELHDRLADDDLVEFVEVEPQTLWLPPKTGTSRPQTQPILSDRLASLGKPRLVHSVGVPVGSVYRPSPEHLEVLALTARSFASPWCSEHLSFNRVGDSETGSFAGFFLPPRQTSAGAQAAAVAIDRLRQATGLPIAVENGVNYLQPRADELPDGEFIATVATLADCGILLDLHNLWTNAKNGRQTAGEFLQDLPAHRVWELHVAGGHHHRGYWLDAHSGPIPPELLDLTAAAVPQFANLRAIVFEILPEHLGALGDGGIHEQMRLLHRLWRLRQPGPPSATRPPRRDAPLTAPDDVSDWESELGTLAIGRSIATPRFPELSSDPGLALIQDLVNEARAGAIAGAMRLTTRLLLLSLGSAGVRGLLDDYFSISVPQQYAATEAIEFAGYISDKRLALPYLDDVVSLEAATLTAAVSREPQEVHLEWEPAGVLEALLDGRLPTDVLSAGFSVSISPSPQN